jgi:hypothetical protein
MTTRTPLSNVISAFSLIAAMLIEEIEKAGGISRSEFAKRLRDTADEAEKVAPDALKNDSRVDLQIARHVANLLAPKEKGDASGWNPVVIDGGLSGGPEPEED